MKPRPPSVDTVGAPDSGQSECEALRERLAEAEETLHAIRRGEVDAVIVKSADGPQVYTLLNADRPYRNIVERMQEGALTLAPDGTILYANRRLASFLDLPLPDIVGQKFGQFIAACDRDLFNQLLAEAGVGGGRGELALCPARGEPVPVYLSVVDLQDEDQRIISGIVTDLRWQKLRMQELTEANALLIDAMAQKERAETMLRQAQKMEAVGQLTAGIAHDFNNLLMVISGNLELFESRVSDSWLKQRVEAGLRAVARGARLTQTLLAFARVQNLEPKLISINALLLDIEPLLRSSVGEGIRLKLVLSETLSQSLVDASELQAAILNLTSNAKDAMPGGGYLTITTGEVALDAQPGGGTDSIEGGRYLSIAVTDTGYGIPSEIRERVFDPFFTTKDVGKGSGLGLSRVYGFMRQSGGLVTIESATSVGTTVRLYLPEAENSVVAPAPQAAVEPPRRASETRRVLVVEDDQNLRTLVGEVLTSLGYSVIAVESGPAALSVLDNGTEVDVVFSDVLMPDGMSGFELAHEIRRQLPHLAIVLTSGMSGIPTAAEKAGQNLQLLRKPYKFEALSEAIEMALGAVSRGGDQRRNGDA